VVAGDYNEIDELSIQEIGWSGSQELYDGVYAQTSGDASAKTYAALKASAMWCHLNNDPLNGVLHGKLYNGFALKLIDSDITTFNTNNPASSFGYGLPSDDEITTLVSTIGGSTVAGGHLKFPGTTYWTSPNTGADNSSGFSALQSGYRNADGSFVIGTRFIMWTTTSGITGRNRRLLLDYNSAASNQNINGGLLTLGFSIRMIKR
jgi:uncharacterized protein (TIGR02145 family)